MDLGQRAWRLMLELTKFAPISQSEGEGQVGLFIYNYLKGKKYFRKRPDLLRYLPVATGNKPGVVAAFIKGKGPRTVLLLNHHDVVSIEEYGPYKEFAFDPVALTKALNPLDLPPIPAIDWRSGEWIFGRGTMDMLYGLALQLELTLDFADRETELPGNVLFLSVPDEENNSLGMRQAVSLLRQLQEDKGLVFIAAVNSEPHGYDKDGHLIQTGSDGKLLPLIYCLGKETHAGALYEGLNANLLLAQVISILELNPGFCDQHAGEVTFPPTVLRASDLKEDYNVSTPLEAWALFNLFTLGTTPGSFLAKIVSLCKRACALTKEKILLSAKAWENISGQKTALAPLEIPVVTFSQLLAEVGNRSPDLDSLAAELIDRGADMQRLSLELLREVQRYSEIQGPKIVIALAPPFYPPLVNRRQTPKELFAMDAVASVQGYAHSLGIDLAQGEYHRGISDLSYCALQAEADIAATFSENCPSWGRGYDLPLADIACIDAPAINLGPWGRDVHQWTERIHRPYATEILPLLLRRLLERLLPEEG